MRFFKIAVLVVVILSISCCASKKDLLYLQDAQGQGGDLTRYEPTLKADDLLSIIVSSENPENTFQFNMPAIQGNYDVSNNQNGIKTYLVDNDGFIDFPVLGKVQMGGLTRTQAKDKLVKAISEYIKNPAVNLRILNYKVSVLGEVRSPGSYTLQSERISLLEALSLSGDLTIYGDRHNILVIREVDGKKNYTRVDITKSDFTNSPYYYLTQNDVVVVDPNKTRINASAVGPNLAVIISALSLLTSIIVILTR